MAKKVITELTPAQEAEIPVWRERWVKHALCTEPANRPEAERAIIRIYEIHGFKKPEFRWFLSPGDAIEAIAKESGRELTTSQGEEWWGQHEAYWCCYYTYCRDVLGVEYPKDANEQLDLWSAIAKSCNWWWPYEGVCFVVDRPEVLSFDDQENPHKEDGPFLKFRNGESYYAIHGVQIFQPLIVEHPEQITVQMVDEEADLEVKRIMIERMGYKKYLHESGAKLVDMDGGLGLEGSACRSLMEDKHGFKFLVGTDGSTARVYIMNVPREAKTCVEAHSMIAGFDESRIIAEA